MTKEKQIAIQADNEKVQQACYSKITDKNKAIQNYHCDFEEHIGKNRRHDLHSHMVLGENLCCNFTRYLNFEYSFWKNADHVFPEPPILLLV